MRDFPKLTVVNLSELYLTREAFWRAQRRIDRKIGNCKGSIFMLSVVTGLLIGAVIEQKQRLDELERRIKVKDEMAERREPLGGD